MAEKAETIAKKAIDPTVGKYGDRFVVLKKFKLKKILKKGQIKKNMVNNLIVLY